MTQHEGDPFHPVVEIKNATRRGEPVKEIFVDLSVAKESIPSDSDILKLRDELRALKKN